MKRAYTMLIVGALCVIEAMVLDIVIIRTAINTKWMLLYVLLSAGIGFVLIFRGLRLYESLKGV